MKNLKAGDVMTRPVVSARKNASARDIAMQLLSGLYSGLPVTDDEGRGGGIVTEFDLILQVGYLNTVSLRIVEIAPKGLDSLHPQKTTDKVECQTHSIRNASMGTNRFSYFVDQ